MRTEKEMMDLMLDIARQDSRIRIMTLEGSRTNVNIPKDEFQDYDVTYFVTDVESFTLKDEWLKSFGNIIMMQKPEDMELFPAEESGYSYIMYFDDYNKIDLTLLPLEELKDYLNGDKLMQVILDKDGRIDRDVVPTDIDYHVRKPSAREYDDCCNEFWNVTPYVVKGLCRKEILFAIDHLNEIVRHELLRMISWKVGIETGFQLSVGKNYKFIDRYISEDLWKRLLSTYRMDSCENVWEALLLCHQLFREVSGEVAERLHYDYPEYDKNITKYTRDMHKKYTGETGCLDSTYAADIEERREQ
ncbi:aminoglycoside 6-adenylyltransferase [Campylobacter jejuni]|nr:MULTISPECIES: aminoglycoside 6-adenylyltransferase [Campylobacter]EAH4531968.1 aminoglycoside 6-adenylyltransferase [Campylobacter jejuni]EAH4533018.1 aminoglycoside 6-adenylyltransferase [Campylobacter jejuni]EAI3657350.1 aminoglycoside 6-adenylyltransferase [Campylobacter jejuni]EAI3658781.1 aminoglycoside 6-adenylyltransferase [Campylobacter jejuni]EAI6783227.1 aminoglycoside 6-adenylyltransferase [Campylobacter jejuni]